MNYLLFFIILLLIIIYRLNKHGKDLENKLRNLHSEVSLTAITERLNREESLNKLLEDQKLIVKAHKDFIDEVLNGLRHDAVLLPSLIRWADQLEEYKNDEIVHYLYTKQRPAFKAADEIKKVKDEARACRREIEFARNRVQLYESLAPWLIDFTELSLEELLESLRDNELQIEDKDTEYDPVSNFLSKTEWTRLNTSEKNQLALERYKDPHRTKSPWVAGIMYERYIGYVFETQGYAVQYHGATQGKEDLGIDLICENQDTILIVQCKRLSSIKGIPVRENVIAQTYGTAQHYKMKTNTAKKVVPTIATTYELSEEAERFSEYLGVQVFQNFALADYPMIKCNISSVTKEKIYHLPMDQQYDKVIIGDEEGDFYAEAIAEAEAKGFRRAFRWKGNS